MLDKKFGSAGNEMVIEEFMVGREVSVLSFVDGNTIKTMTSAQVINVQDDGDTGLIPAEWVHSRQARSTQKR